MFCDVAGSDEKYVDPVHRKQTVDIADSLQRLDHRDDQPLFVIGRTGVANRIDDGTGLIRGIDHRHRQSVRPGIQIADQQRTLVRIRSDSRRSAGAANDLRGNAHILETPGAMLAIDENRVGAKLHQSRRKAGRNVVGVEHRDCVAFDRRSRSFAPFRGMVSG
jgi:hypothetical protein